MKQRIAAVSFWSLGVMAMIASCGDDPAPESLCDPGSNVFCRCRGTLDPGTKLCNDSGDGFGPCEGPIGECDEAPIGGSGGSGASGGGPPEPPKPGELFAPCDPENGVECGEGLECLQGYCTMSCTEYLDCQPLGDCVIVGSGSAACAPYCVEQEDCAKFGTASSCGYTDNTLPPFDVVVCANHGDDLFLPPDGYACDSDSKCNLGFDGTERVCDTEICTDGCHANVDCSEDGATCSSSGGDLGDCGGGSGEDVDVCPGVSVAISAAMAQVQVGGDTSAAPPPSEADGDSPCQSLSPTEEDIYHLTVADAGSVIVLIDTTAADYDPILYVRSGSCEAGTQVACADDEALGLGEIVEFPATAGEEFWIFADGFDGSSGVYTIDFDLTPQ